MRWLLMDRPVAVHPVIDLPTLKPQCGYRPSRRMREGILSVFPTELSPFSTNNSRRLELDHAVTYRRTPQMVEPSPAKPAAGRCPEPVEGSKPTFTVAETHRAPPGQTRVGNIAPLNARVHRAKTAGHWQVEQPEPGVLLWRSPLGFRYRVLVDSTEILG